MAITDQYVVQYLLGETLAPEGSLRWSPKSNSYSVELNGVRIELFESQTRGWSGVCLGLHRDDQVAYIEEPRSSSIFGRRHENPDDHSLAELLRALYAAAAGQCSARQTRAWQDRDSNREQLYRLVLFGK